ncbi:MAG TPA: hypothetical protein VMQ17_16650 [Candidatus Sulfotelmatobacter sp.]|nr:hypothetical protein [Candidatus Sulfotelmatobacter sp.]
MHQREDRLAVSLVVRRNRNCDARHVIEMVLSPGLAVDAAKFFLAHEEPAYGTRDPVLVSFTTVRIELFVDDPVAKHRQAVAAGAANHSPVEEHEHSTSGPKPINRMLQGRVVDPFGQMWLIGKIHG